MISKKYNEQMGNYLAKLAQTQNNLGTWQERILAERKQTNADRIRAMSDEELAGWLADHPVVSEYDKNNPQHKAWLDWLRQEVSE